MPTLRCNMKKKYTEGFMDETFVDGLFPTSPMREEIIDNVSNGTLYEINENIIKSKKNEYIKERDKFADNIKNWDSIEIPDTNDINELIKQVEPSANDDDEIIKKIREIENIKKNVENNINDHDKNIQKNNNNLETNRVNSNALQKERERIERDTYTFHKTIANGRQKLLFGRNISIILIIINIFLLVYLFYSIKNLN